MYYFDHAAATPVLPQAMEAMTPYFAEWFFNPSAPYLPAKQVREAYEQAKDQIAHWIGAKGANLIMTSGATESINLAFTARQGKALVLETEHPAVRAVASAGEVEFVAVDRTGLIKLEDLRQKLDDEVDFVSISLANNELGTIQPLAEVAEMLRQVRQERWQRGVARPIYLHSDASQALCLMDINVARLGVDLLTLNAAKCGGPKGVGALYVANGIKLRPLTLGGGQERGLRSGTENVSGVIGFAAALEQVQTHLVSNRKKYAEMAKALRAELTQVDGVVFLGNAKHQLANFLPVSFPGIDAERLIYKLEARGVLVSTGAACAANKRTKSHVLQAIGLSEAEIAGSLRISLGSTNTLEGVKEAAAIMREEVEREYARLEGHE